MAADAVAAKLPQPVAAKLLILADVVLLLHLADVKLLLLHVDVALLLHLAVAKSQLATADAEVLHLNAVC